MPTDSREQLQTALAGRYVIERELGRGGMATVYLARDVRHDRLVALKLLNPELGAVLGAERFLSEIRVTANLQHPNLLPLFDSGEANGLLFYVMPYVEGESLRQRIDRERQLPVAEAVRIAVAIAGALDYAHRRGVIHRDLKPENILLHEGQPLVADFGIALAVSNAGGQRVTQTGLSLGTPQYMSPEQATGDRGVDSRTDIYSLGAVTYEMLAGEPPHSGTTAQAIIARLMTEDPRPLTTLRKSVPLHVEAAIHRALEKLPADRHASAADLAAELQDTTARTTRALPHAIAARSSGGRLRDPMVLGLAALVVLLGLTTWLGWRDRGATDSFAMRSIITPEGEGNIGAAGMSPDGRSVVYSGVSRSGRGRVLYVRRLDEVTSREIAAGARAVGPGPVFSPDGKWIAYVENRRRVMKVPAEGGNAVPLADVSDNGGVDWSPDDEIIIGAGVDEGLEGLSRVSANGGAVRELTRVDTTRGEMSHQAPRVLPDGSGVLFTIRKTAEQFEIGAASLRDDQPHTPLGIQGRRAIGVIDGQLLYQDTEGAILAVAFDARRLRVEGTPVPVQEGLRLPGGSDLNSAFLTNAGGLVYMRGNANRRLVWVDRKGAVTVAVDAPREFQHVALSLDGRRVATTIVNGIKRDIWILDLGSGTLTPLTNVGSARNPMWSPDGRRILFASTHGGGRAAFWWQDADGNGPAVEAVVPRHNPWNAHLSPDGRRIVFNAISQGSFNLETVSLDSTHDAQNLAASATATEVQGRFSPNGKLVAYNSDESGRSEVYIRPSTPAGGRIQVSVNGGRKPVWSRDGKRLHYFEEDRLVEATLALAENENARVLSRVVLFSGRYVEDFDVAPDGRFLMIEGEDSGVSLVAVPNWRAELRRLRSK